MKSSDKVATCISQREDHSYISKITTTTDNTIHACNEDKSTKHMTLHLKVVK